MRAAIVPSINSAWVLQEVFGQRHHLNLMQDCHQIYSDYSLVHCGRFFYGC
jgi:hypothetical protein